MNIIIIDDVKGDRYLLSDILRKLSWNMVEAEDCADALKMLQINPNFDLVFADWRTPKMDGIEFLKNVRSDPKLKNIKVIMITGMDDMENVKEALACGVDEYLMKPISEEMVFDKLRLIGVEIP